LRAILSIYHLIRVGSGSSSAIECTGQCLFRDLLFFKTDSSKKAQCDDPDDLYSDTGDELGDINGLTLGYLCTQPSAPKTTIIDQNKVDNATRDSTGPAGVSCDRESERVEGTSRARREYISHSSSRVQVVKG